MPSVDYHPPFGGFSCPLTAQCHAANVLNMHETLRSRPTTWMVSGYLPHIDPEIAKYPKDGGNSISVRNVELMSQCSECLFEGWNETDADLLPMEFADGKTRLTHVVAVLSITGQRDQLVQRCCDRPQDTERRSAGVCLAISKTALSGQVQLPGLCVCLTTRIQSHPLSSLS
jgi:hypothetical protein